MCGVWEKLGIDKEAKGSPGFGDDFWQLSSKRKRRIPPAVAAASFSSSSVPGSCVAAVAFEGFFILFHQFGSNRRIRRW